MAHDNLYHHDGSKPHTSYLTSRAFLVFLGFSAIAIVLLWQEHKVHILGALPLVFLFACLFLHRFMHGGHGRSRRNQIKTGPDGGNP